MNHFVGLGRLTREPEVSYTQNGKVYCKFTVAIDRPFRKDRPTLLTAPPSARLARLSATTSIRVAASSSMAVCKSAATQARMAIRSKALLSWSTALTSSTARTAHLLITAAASQTWEHSRNWTTTSASK